MLLLVGSSLAIVGLNGRSDDPAQQANAEQEIAVPAIVEKSGPGEDEKELEQNEDDISAVDDMKSEYQIGSKMQEVPITTRRRTAGIESAGNGA